MSVQMSMEKASYKELLWGNRSGFAHSSIVASEKYILFSIPKMLPGSVMMTESQKHHFPSPTPCNMRKRNVRHVELSGAGVDTIQLGTCTQQPPNHLTAACVVHTSVAFPYYFLNPPSSAEKFLF